MKVNFMSQKTIIPLLHLKRFHLKCKMKENRKFGEIGKEKALKSYKDLSFLSLFTKKKHQLN